MTKENSRIVKYQGPQVISFSGFDEILSFAKVVTKTELVPKTYRGKPEDGAVAIMYGMELGLPPMASLQNIAVVNGTPTIWGDAQLSLVQSSGSYEWHKTSYTGTIEGETLTATFEVKRKDMAESVVKEFSISDAKKARLWAKQGTWTSHPKQMLGYKARAFALREAFADILKGIHSKEEMEGEGEIKDVTPLTPVHNAADLDAAMQQIIEPKKEPVIINEDQIDMFPTVLESFEAKINNASEPAELEVVGREIKSYDFPKQDRDHLETLYKSKINSFKHD